MTRPDVPDGLWAIDGVATHKCPLRFRRPDGGVDWRKVRAEDAKKAARAAQED